VIRPFPTVGGGSPFVKLDLDPTGIAHPACGSLAFPSRHPLLLPGWEAPPPTLLGAVSLSYDAFSGGDKSGVSQDGLSLSNGIVIAVSLVASFNETTHLWSHSGSSGLEIDTSLAPCVLCLAALWRRRESNPPHDPCKGSSPALEHASPWCLPLAASPDTALDRGERLLEGYVELTGFEPATSTLPAWRSTGLSYSPDGSETRVRTSMPGVRVQSLTS
jgi:hypothetical protein